MVYNYPRFPGGKMKAVTLSYDDGSVHDIKFAEIINRYGLKCTFNLLGGRVEAEAPLTKKFIKENILDKGHEVANHGYAHRALDTLRPIEAIRELLDSRLALEKAFGTIVRGLAFPDRTVNRFKTPALYEQVKGYLSELDIAYARCSGGIENDTFMLPEDFYNWEVTAHHNNPRLMEYADKFLAIDVDAQYISRRFSRVFFMYGHSFEFDRDGNWEHLEAICQRLSGRDDIWYATNIEIYNYIHAYRSLVYSADGHLVYNPTLYEIWFDVDHALYHIRPGETRSIKNS